MRRISRSLAVLKILGLDCPASFTSRCQLQRAKALAAVDVCTTRPLLGAAILICGNDRALYHHWITADGREDGNSPSGALFPYWSFTKTAISICALKLVEGCHLTLDAVVPGQQYTLRQLLQHTSGLPDYEPLKSYRQAVPEKEEPWSRQKLLEETMAQCLDDLRPASPLQISWRSQPPGQSRCRTRPTVPAAASRYLRLNVASSPFNVPLQ
ncbi:serine hydrolase domain-containing protein [uncultured Roseobacter sp.]|uniref:serine hydrolase domain-containing protein n=1 Tax=uncultured Roseobacter sp. TaxID=114847 RepID=UPI00262DD1DE|nr:serine hydrolase domain-containing protein [uncultured Roseobacter sp.]